MADFRGTGTGTGTGGRETKAAMQYSQLGGGAPPTNDGSFADMANESEISPNAVDVHDNRSVSMSVRSNAKSTSQSFRTVSVGNQDLKEPLTAIANHQDDDPFYVFREDLYRKLDLVDDGLAEFLRMVHQTVSSVLLFLYVSQAMNTHSYIPPFANRTLQ